MGLFHSNVNKTRCNTACAAINTCFTPPPTAMLDKKKERIAQSNATYLLSQSKTAIDEAKRNTNKQEAGKTSKKDPLGYVNKLGMLVQTFSSIIASIKNTKSYLERGDQSFVPSKVSNAVDAAKANFESAITIIGKNAPTADSLQDRKFNRMGAQRVM